LYITFLACIIQLHIYNACYSLLCTLQSHMCNANMLHLSAVGKTSLEALHIPVDKLCHLRGARNTGYWSYPPSLSGLSWSHTTQTIHICQSLAALRPFWSSTEEPFSCQKDSGSCVVL